MALGVGAYAVGVGWCLVVGSACAVIAVRVRTRLVPGWSGPPARLAEAVLAAAALVAIGEALGAVGLLRRWAVLAAAVALAAAAAAALRGAPGAGVDGDKVPILRRPDRVA